MRRLVSIAAFTLVLAAPAWAPAWAQGPVEKRVALVIGNSAYKEAPLKNPVNDARAMAARLKELGFEVIARENASRDQMGQAIVDFGKKLGPDTAALFFYAGHGIQSRGRNYLLPVDITLNAESDLRFRALDVTALLEEIEQGQTRVSFVILDACRNNPFERRLRGAARGLAVVDAARGSLIAYATAPGSVAADGEGDNGVYSAALLKALAQPGLKAEDVFKRVRIQVADQTNKTQTPWESSSLTGDFIFNPTVTVAPTVTIPAVPPATADREALFWQSVKDSKSAGDFEDYLKRYPQGEYASLAKRRMDELKKPPQQAVVPPATQSAPPAVTSFDGIWKGRDGNWMITLKVEGAKLSGEARCSDLASPWSVQGRAAALGSVEGSASIFVEPAGSKGGGTQPIYRLRGTIPAVKLISEGSGSCGDATFGLVREGRN